MVVAADPGALSGVVAGSSGSATFSGMGVTVHDSEGGRGAFAPVGGIFGSLAVLGAARESALVSGG